MEKAVILQKQLCRAYGEGNTTSMTVACYPEDGNVKAEGVSEAAGQRAALETYI